MQITTLDWHPFEKNTLKGFASLALGQSGLRVYDCPVHCKNDKWWVAFPARSYIDKSGVQCWQPILEFGDEDSRARFQELALAALRWKFPNIFPSSLVKAKDTVS